MQGCEFGPVGTDQGRRWQVGGEYEVGDGGLMLLTMTRTCVAFGGVWGGGGLALHGFEVFGGSFFWHFYSGWECLLAF